MSYLFHSCDKLSSILIFSENDFLKYTDRIDKIFSEDNTTNNFISESNSNSSITEETDFYGEDSLFSLRLSTIKKIKESKE